MIHSYNHLRQKGFTLIELLVVVAIIGVLASIGVFAFSKFTTAAKISAAKQQHQKIVNFIKTSFAQCRLGENYIVMKTCNYAGFSCNGLKVGNNSTPGEINRPCKSGAGSASNSSYHFTFHFNYSGMKNPYGLEGPIGSNIGGKMKDQCCLMQSWDPRTLGRTHIWNKWPTSKISIKTNIGDSNGSNKYLFDEVEWPKSGF